MISQELQIDRRRLSEICRGYHVQRLSLFGSVLRADFTPESDVDVLVEFEPGTRHGLRFFALEEELSALLGRKVDLNTPAFLDPEFREDVISTAVVLYDAGT
jgi:uncharacterized protein